MKHYLYLILLLGWHASCTQPSNHYPHFMKVAESYMNTQPEEALKILQDQKDSLQRLSEEARIYYDLLTLQAEDCQYIIHTDDSLVRRIVQFYESHGNPTSKTLAYYLMGKVYRDMNDAPQALKAFQQALDVESENLSLRVNIYQEMYPLFANQGLYDDAIQIQKKAIDIHLLQDNRNDIVSIQRNIARMFEQKAEKDSAIHYYQKACVSALNISDSATYYNILADLTGLRYETGETSDAIHTLKRIEQRKDILDKSDIHFLFAQIYKDNGQWDSVYHYSLMVVQSGNIEKAYYSYIDLYALEKQKKNYRQAMEYMEKALDSKNLMQTISQRESFAQINSLYNYQHISDENADLRLNKEKQKNVILILTLLTVGILFAGFAFVAYQRKRSRQILERERKLKQLSEERYAKSQMAIQDNERKLEELTRQLAVVKAENDTQMYGPLETEMKKLQLKNEEIRLSQHVQKQRIKHFMDSSLYKLIQQAALDDTILIKDESWEKMQEAIDFMYPTFNTHLDDLFPSMNSNAKKLCWLTKIGISPTGIAHILKRSKQAITNTRTKLNKTIFELSLPENTFDEFIANLS